MEKRGWRAIIYDAPWVKFVLDDGESGVVISEDGKSCETLNDDISSIRVVKDPDAKEKGTGGHILFRQKGSDLFDIVCLK